MSTLLLDPAIPAEAAAAFGESLGAARTFARLLAGPGVERGLIGPRERDRLWERHLLNCAGSAELLGPGEAVLDLGSGAGLPGLVLALLRPDLTVELVEPLLRRATFLTEAVAELGLGNVTVTRARAEDLPGRAADAVTARAVAPLHRLAGWAMPLLRPGGRLLALKGARAQEELASSTVSLRRAGAADADVVRVGSVEQLTQAWVVVVVRAEAGLTQSSVGPTRARSGHTRGRR